jgi:hypothetical protein
LPLYTALNSDPTREALDGAAGSRFGNMLAPQGLALCRLTAKLLAVTRPLDALVLRLQDLHRTTREGISTQDRRLSVGTSSSRKSQCHAPSITRSGCGSPVDYLCIIEN